ncbi:MAG: extensin family protein [Sulfitobacter sp.]|nr:extensin family protein [Sulfitobacter sp.]
MNHFSTHWGPGSIEWIGDVGAKVCKTGCHSSGRAVDITAVRLGSTTVDTNQAWRGTTQQKRQYLAIWAAFRRDVGTVLTNAFNSDHQDHMHVDNGATAPTIRTSAKTDTTLVQTACNLLNGASLSVDGVWGSGTEAAYQSLLVSLLLHCTNPKSSSSACQQFLELITKTAIANTTAGTYTGGCSGYPI